MRNLATVHYSQPLPSLRSTPPLLGSWPWRYHWGFSVSKRKYPTQGFRPSCLRFVLRGWQNTEVFVSHWLGGLIHCRASFEPFAHSNNAAQTEAGKSCGFTVAWVVARLSCTLGENRKSSDNEAENNLVGKQENTFLASCT